MQVGTAHPYARMVRRKPATVIGVLGVEFDHHNWITIGCERAVRAQGVPYSRTVMLPRGPRPYKLGRLPGGQLVLK